MKIRPAHALAVALLALVVAMAGTSYAAAKITSAQIKNNTIKSKDIKDNEVAGKDVKDASLTGADIADGSLTAADLPPSTASCPAGTLKLGGVCLIKAARGPANINSAIADCNSLGGRIIGYQEVKLLALVNAQAQGVTWTMNMLNQYEFTNNVTMDSTVLSYVLSDYSGNVIAEDGNTARGYHCIVLPS